MRYPDRRSITASPLRLLRACILAAAAYVIASGADNPGFASGVAKTFSYPSVVAQARPWHPEKKVWGRVAPFKRYVVTAPVSMTVTSAPAFQDASVRAGETLLTFTSPGLVALFTNMDDARRRAEVAARHRARVRKNSARGLVTENLTYQADSDYLAREHDLNRAWAALDDVLTALGHRADLADVESALAKSGPRSVAATFATVLSPFTADVLKSTVSPGSVLMKGAPMLWLQDTARIFVDAELPVTDLNRLRHYSASLVAGGSRRENLDRVGVAPRIDPATGLAVLRFSAMNPEGDLHDRQWVPVTLRGPERTVPWVPSSSVVERNGATFCIVARSGKYVRVAVEAGSTQGGMVPVLSGLSAGDRVVTTGAYELLYRDLSTIMPPSD